MREEGMLGAADTCVPIPVEVGRASCSRRDKPWSTWQRVEKLERG